MRPLDRDASHSQRYCLAGLSDIGALGADFAADFGAGLCEAEAGAEFVGGLGVPSSCAADWAGGAICWGAGSILAGA